MGGGKPLAGCYNARGSETAPQEEVPNFQHGLWVGALKGDSGGGAEVWIQQKQRRARRHKRWIKIETEQGRRWREQQRSPGGKPGSIWSFKDMKQQEWREKKEAERVAATDKETRLQSSHLVALSSITLSLSHAHSTPQSKPHLGRSLKPTPTSINHSPLKPCPIIPIGPCKSETALVNVTAFIQKTLRHVRRPPSWRACEDHGFGELLPEISDESIGR